MQATRPCHIHIAHEVGRLITFTFTPGGETAGSGFKAQYTFETEYQIPGSRIPSLVFDRSQNFEIGYQIPDQH